MNLQKGSGTPTLVLIVSPKDYDLGHEKNNVVTFSITFLR